MVLGQNRNPTTTRGGKVKLDTSDDDAADLLNQILVQMKITNFYLSILTDNEVTDEEIT